MTSSVEKLYRLIPEDKRGSSECSELVSILDAYDSVVNNSEELIRKIGSNPSLSDSDKLAINFLQYEHKHLWHTIAILSTDKQTTQAQIVRDSYIEELCETVLQPSYYGVPEESAFAQVLKRVRESVKTYNSVVVFKTKE